MASRFSTYCALNVVAVVVDDVYLNLGRDTKCNVNFICCAWEIDDNWNEIKFDLGVKMSFAYLSE